MTVSCWEGEHTKFAFGVALPAMLIWSVFVPLFMWVYMYRHRKQLNTVRALRSIGFLYSGYRRELYYWEFIVVLRKSLMVFVANILGTLTVEVQAATAIAVLWFFLMVEAKAFPFETKRFNRTEYFSLMANLITVFGGTLYLSSLRLSPGATVVLLVVVLGVNGVFLGYWVWLFVLYLMQLLSVSKANCLRRIFSFKNNAKATQNDSALS